MTAFYYHSQACSSNDPDDPSKNFLQEYPTLAPNWAWHGNVL